MSTIPDEVIEDLDPAEIGNTGCLIPENDDEGHCDAAAEEDDDVNDDD